MIITTSCEMFIIITTSCEMFKIIKTRGLALIGFLMFCDVLASRMTRELFVMFFVKCLTV
jgi:hypothetical protein